MLALPVHTMNLHMSCTPNYNLGSHRTPRSRRPCLGRQVAGERRELVSRLSPPLNIQPPALGSNLINSCSSEKWMAKTPSGVRALIKDDLDKMIIEPTAGRLVFNKQDSPDWTFRRRRQEGGIIEIVSTVGCLSLARRTDLYIVHAQCMYRR